MNEFVNPHHRGVDLPAGFKDLAQILASKKSSAVPGPLSFERRTNGLSHVKKFLNLFLNSKMEDPLLTFTFGGYNFSLQRSGESLEAYVSFSPGDLVLERALRKIFAEIGVIPVSVSKVPCVYRFRMPMGGQTLEIVTKVFQAYGVTDTDEIGFLLRA